MSVLCRGLSRVCVCVCVCAVPCCAVLAGVVQTMAKKMGACRTWVRRSGRPTWVFLKLRRGTLGFQRTRAAASV